MKRLLPGLGIVALATGISYAVNTQIPVISALLIAILLGILARNTGMLPGAADPGVAFAAKTVLRTGVVLLGFQLSLPVIAKLGWGPVLAILLTVSVTFLSTLWIGHLMGISRPDRILTATGTSICGAAAVAAMSAVVGTYSDGDDDVDNAAATAVAGVTVFGTIAMLVLPAIIGVTSLSELAQGVWIGSGIHEVGQVVAAGGLVGPDVLETAVITKLGRVLLLAPIVVMVGSFLARSAQTIRGCAQAERDLKRPPIMPLFVAGFITMVLLRSLLDLPALGISPDTVQMIADPVKIASTLLLTAAMFGMGAGVRLKVVLTTGRKPLALAACAGTIAACVSLGGALLFV